MRIPRKKRDGWRKKKLSSNENVPAGEKKGDKASKSGI